MNESLDQFDSFQKQPETLRLAERLKRDRELLELAAKAAGATWIDDNWPEDLPGLMLDFGQGTTQWLPLTDDGDAFRLALKLKFCVRVDVRVCVAGSSPTNDWMEPYIGDPSASCRRAIVSAAAAIASATGGAV